ncbi:MAG: HAD-IB family phosphatase [Parcubacteria group bacterium]|nr:HAD-IB family phosphatase [Parcubacteria group bacterium]
MDQPTHVVVVDFDNTLISNSLHYRVEESGILRKDLHAELFGLRNQNLARLDELTDEESYNWAATAIEAYVNSGLSMEDIEKVLEGVKLKEGVVEFIDFLGESNIPLAIISSGIDDFIRIILRKHSLSFSINEVFATKLITDFNDFGRSYGRIRGFNSGSVVTPGNKRDFSLYFSEIFQVHRDSILAIGDSSFDRNLGHLKRNRLGVAETQGKAERIAPFFGEVIVTDHFVSVQEWVMRKILQ